LEVGAGTGGTTQTFLKDLVDAEGHPTYSLYTFTDISDGFFPMAKQRFSYAPNMEFKVFDISKEPFKQGFEAKTYDLILAANVVHATPVLLDTLRHLRLLLSPTGRLVLTELTTTI
jgi:SAM-dependent methyltransferase